jgi:hypothetical protein
MIRTLLSAAGLFAMAAASVAGTDPEEPDEPPTGVEVDQLQKAGAPARYWRRGALVDREDVLRAVGQAKTIPDDRGKYRLTVIGSDAERQPVLDDYKKSVEAELRTQILVWSVPPDHWSLHDSASGTPLFKTDGHPTIYLQAADGKVLHRQDGYSGPADFAAIRKATGYDPARDRNLNKTDGAGSSAIPPVVWAAGGAVLVYLVLRNRKKAAP